MVLVYTTVMHEQPDHGAERAEYAIECADSDLRLTMEQLIERYRIVETVSDLTNLPWIAPIIIRHDTIPTADFKGTNTAIVDFSKRHWALQGIAHEMVHLLVRQNSWSANPRLISLIHRFPELTHPHGPGYLLEQMAAYLVMVEVMKGVGRDIQNARMISGWTHERFDEVIAREYKTPLKERLGRAIIAAWPERVDMRQPLTDWMLDVAERSLAE